jgi:hypothetical protein
MAGSYRLGMGEAPGPRDLSDVPVTCLLCHQVHERCVFAALTNLAMPRAYRPGNQVPAA